MTEKEDFEVSERVIGYGKDGEKSEEDENEKDEPRSFDRGFCA